MHLVRASCACFLKCHGESPGPIDDRCSVVHATKLKPMWVPKYILGKHDARRESPIARKDSIYKRQELAAA